VFRLHRTTAGSLWEHVSPLLPLHWFIALKFITSAGPCQAAFLYFRILGILYISPVAFLAIRPVAAARIFPARRAVFCVLARRGAVFQKIFFILKNRLTISRPHGRIIGVRSLD
jgi:hypothetical protein